MANLNDLCYIQCAKAGDLSAFAQIISNHQQMVFNIILRIVNNREDAEDITQEVFVKVFKSLQTFKEESEFSTWLYRIAYNTTLSEIRKKKIVYASLDENFSNDSNEDISDEIEDITKEERLQYLEQALRRLPPDDALIITMFYMNDKTIDEISQISNLSQANVKVKLHRIRKKLAIEINKLMER